MNRDRLNVLFVTPWYPTRDHCYNGVFVREYARAVQTLCDVVVLHLAVSDPYMRQWWTTRRETDGTLTAGIPTYRAVYRRSQIRGLTWPRYWAGVMRAAGAIWNAHGPFDIVHAHVYSAGSAALMVGRWRHIPVVISEHSTGFTRGTLPGSEIGRARKAFGKANVVLPVSRFLQRAIEQYGITAEFRVVPNVVDTDMFSHESWARSSDGTVRMLTVTSFVEHKGLAVLFRALKEVSWRDRSWRLDVAGGGAGASEYRRMAEDMGLSRNVKFHGAVAKSEIARMMKDTDFFVLPSLVETFSVATAEALASGLPVVVTRSGGPEEFVDDSCGIVVAPGDATALAGGINRMVDSLKDYGRDEIARVAKGRFGYESVGSAITDVYSSAVRRNTVARSGQTVKGRLG